jgi:hypothetical protein
MWNWSACGLPIKKKKKKEEKKESVIGFLDTTHELN